ncbi:MAG: hypothetical protein ACE5I1_18030 [bacterium]
MPNAIALGKISGALTLEIVKKIVALPVNKKKALLELLGDLPDELNGQNAKEFKRKAEIAEWKKELLTTSVWTDEEIAEIEKAREYINSWHSLGHRYPDCHF